MRRLLPIAFLLLLPAVASAQQSATFYLGGFVPKSLNSRDANDVLVQDSTFLDFNMSDLNGVTVGGEYLVGLGDKFDAGLGVGYYQKTAVAADAFNEFQGTGAPIVANLTMKIVPFTATVRWLPLGHNGGFQPYVGGGIGVMSWRYTESGNFVASDGATIVNGTFSGSGSAVGPLILGGVRVPVSQAFSLGGEVRFQGGKGDLPADQGFAGSQVDLGGFTYALTFNVRF